MHFEFIQVISISRKDIHEKDIDLITKNQTVSSPSGGQYGEQGGGQRAAFGG